MIASPPAMTKEAFFAEYQRRLSESCPRAGLSELDHHMGLVRYTLQPNGFRNWDINTRLAIATWRAIGGKGLPTYKALRALPQGAPP